MTIKTACATLFIIFIRAFTLQISAQHIVDLPMTGDTQVVLNQAKIVEWLQKQVKPNLLKQLWDDPKNLEELHIKNWSFDKEDKKYQLDIVLHWTDRRTDSHMAIEGRIEFSYPIQGDAVFRTVGKTKNLIELEQIREISVPGMLTVNSD